MSLLNLLGTLTESLSSAKTSLSDTAAIAPSSDGISLLDTKNDLLLSYLQNLVFLIILKLRNAESSSGESPNETISDEEAVQGLVSLRVYLERGVRPLETRLRYQLDKLLLVANDAKVRSHAMMNGATHRIGKSSQKLDRERSATSASPSQSPPPQPISHIADLSHRPNPSAFVRPTIRAASPTSRPTSVYRPPQINPTLPPALEKAHRKPRISHTLNEYVREELDDVPIAQPSIGAGTGLRGKAAEKEAERRGYEEQRLVRLPGEGRKGKRRREVGDGFGEDLILGGAGQLDDLVKGAKKKKRVEGVERIMGEAWEKRVKRGLGRKRR